MWPRHIEQWRRYVVWESRDIPTDLVLAIIQGESKGQAGIPSTANTKPGEVLTDSGDTVIVTNALGLMQVIPRNIQRWNEKKTQKITYEDMTGDDERAVRLQIRIGCSIFAACVHKLNEFDPVTFPGKSSGTATPEQLKIALVCYGIGSGKPGGKKGTIPKLESLTRQGKPLTLVSLRVNFPRWGYSEKKGRWINRPVQSATKKWKNYQKHATGKPVKQPAPPLPGLPPETPDKKHWLAGWILPSMLIAAILWFERKSLEKLFK